jgi:hypothetical protein
VVVAVRNSESDSRAAVHGMDPVPAMVLDQAMEQASDQDRASVATSRIALRDHCPRHAIARGEVAVRGVSRVGVRQGLARHGAQAAGLVSLGVEQAAGAAASAQAPDPVHFLADSRHRIRGTASGARPMDHGAGSDSGVMMTPTKTISNDWALMTEAAGDPADR